MRYADRMSQLGTETAFEVLAKARALEAKGRSVVHLEIGEPDFDTPAPIRAAAVRALEEGFTHYGPSAGLPEVREAIAAFIARDRRLAVTADQVVVTPGGKPVLTFAILACVNPGDEVIVPNPGFPIYESAVRFAGGTAVSLALREERSFRFGAADLEALLTPRTKMVVLNSPHNPTGSVLTPGDLDEIAALLKDRDIWVLSDEIYSKILYDGVHESIATRPGMQERTVILDGFSKTYAMTGWRLGYGVMNPTLAKHVARLATNVYSCATSFVQRAAPTALSGPQDEVKAMVAEFRRRRDAIVSGLNEIPGVTCAKPAGAFYVFPNVKGLGMNSSEAEHALLEEGGVAALSGAAFGSFGEGYLRFSYANSIENIREGLRRFNAFAQSHAKAAR
ncbi:MAG TPA: pyridoxal phosphate-dependent aminotransferase [Candidatus Limnocylindrales bacterium]|nr:pyridoxal phosphate-dependent aminotransferase [Candidatus Limnocylindrales bacterium]